MTTIIEDCPICYETVDPTRNRCTTPCGHTLCFTCMIQYWNTHPAHTDYACPCCRSVLLAVSDQNIDDQTIDDEDSGDDSTMTEFNEHTRPSHDSATIERIAVECITTGITLTDVLAVLISRGNTWQDRRRFYHSDSIYTRLHCEEIGTVIYDMIDDLDDERCLQLEECVQMDIEDNDSKYIVCREKMNENQGGSVYGTEVALVSNTHERPPFLMGAPGCFACEATGETFLREKESRRLFAF